MSAASGHIDDCDVETNGGDCSCAAKWMARAQKAERLLDEYSRASAAVLDEFHSWPNDKPPVTSKTLRPLWTVYREHAICGPRLTPDPTTEKAKT